MFAADRKSIGLIHNNFQKLSNVIPKQDAEGRNNNLIYLTAIKENANQIDGSNGCKGKDGGESTGFCCSSLRNGMVA